MHCLGTKKVKIICFGIFLLLNIPARAESESTDWATKMYFEDAKYKWYVCVGEDSASEATAINNAIDECYKTAITDNFDVQASVSQQTLETDYDTKVSLRKNIRSDKVQLREFQRTNQKVISGNKIFKAYIQYRYSKSAIAEESLRLSELARIDRGNGAPPDFGVSSEGFGFGASDSGLKYNTRLTVETIPAGARVFIDDEQVGFSSLNISNQFRPQKYNLKITLDGYDDFNQEIDLKEDQPLRIRQKLSKIKIRFQMNVYPEDAAIFVDNKKIDQNWIEIEFDSKINLRFSRKKCADLEVKELKIDQKADTTKDFSLYCESSEEQKRQIEDHLSDSKSESTPLFEKFVDRLNEQVDSYFIGIGAGASYLTTSSSTMSNYTLSGAGIGPEVILMLNGVYIEAASYSYKIGKFTGYKSANLYEKNEKEISFSSKRIKLGFLSRTNTGFLGFALYRESVELEKPETYFEETETFSGPRTKSELSQLDIVGMSFDFYSNDYNSNSHVKFSFQLGSSLNQESKKRNGVIGLGLGLIFGPHK